MSGRILFLDIARNTGWAEGVPGEKIASGSVRLAGDGASHGAIFASLDAWLSERLEARRYSVVAFEQPMDPRHMGKRTTFKTARMLMGLTAIAEAASHRHSVPRVVECDVRDIRKHLLGKQPAKGNAKAEVMQFLAYTGWRAKDDNEADAIAGWLYCEAVLAPQHGADRLPMFSRIKREDRA